MSTIPNERVVETAAKSLDDDDVVLEMIRECVEKNQCYSCVEDESVVCASQGNEDFVVDEKIVNDECAYTFASPFVLSGSEKEQHDGGIFVNMKTRRAVSRKYLRLDSRKTNKQGLYLERRFRKVFDDVVNEEEKEEKKKSNIIEYVLYLWQVENIIRACQFDVNIIEKNVIIKKFKTKREI